MVATDGEDTGSGARKGKILTDGQLARGQGDGAAQAGLEVHRAARVGVEDRLAQRAGAGIVEVGDGSGHQASFEGFQDQVTAVLVEGVRTAPTAARGGHPVQPVTQGDATHQGTPSNGVRDTTTWSSTCLHFNPGSRPE